MRVFSLSVESFNSLDHLAKQVLYRIRILQQEVSMISNQVKQVSMVAQLQCDHLVSFHHPTISSRQPDFTPFDVRTSLKHIIVTIKLIEQTELPLQSRHPILILHHVDVV